MSEPSAFERDQQFESHVLASADRSSSGGREGWNLRFEDFDLWCPATECAQPPAPGETMRLYGKGVGYTVRGIVIGGRVYRYQTEAEERAAHAQWVLDQNVERQKKLDAELADRDARRAVLPDPFRLRIEGFIAARPDWRRDHEPYELFVCEEAARIAAHFGSDLEGLCAFHTADLETQKATVPGLHVTEHSGNTWGAACRLAALCMQSPNLVPQQHGALCPLVGCEEYGCFAARTMPEDPPR